MGQQVAASHFLVGMALQLAAAQRSRGEVPWSGFHIPDTALVTDTPDNRAALPRREGVACRRAQDGVLLHRAGAPQ